MSTVDKKENLMLQDKNGVLSKKAKKSYLSGMMVFEFFVPGMPALAASAGADFLLYDMEHTGISIETLKPQMAACRGLDIAPLVRVPSVEGNTIGQILDIGAHGVMVPMVETADQARDIVRRAYYPPEGQRGTAFSIAHDNYKSGSPADKMAHANQQSVVIAMIETKTGLANVEAIAAVEGIDVLWLGHFDLTSSMGVPGQTDHPEYLAAVSRIVAAATQYGKCAGYMAVDKKWAEEYWGYGFRMLAYGLDHLLLHASLADGMTFISNMASKD